MAVKLLQRRHIFLKGFLTQLIDPCVSRLSVLVQLI